MADAETEFLDITGETCPMTFVRTRLALENLADGATLTVRLKGREPLDNVPRQAQNLGHEVVSLAPETPDGDDDPETVHRLVLRK